MNSKSAPSQIARAPNGEKIRKFPRVQNLTGASFFKVFTCDYTRCVVCLPLWIIDLSFSPFTLYSPSYPILRGSPSGDCPDEDPIASPKLWPPLRAYRGGSSRLHSFDALMPHSFSFECSSERNGGVWLLDRCTLSWLFSGRIDRTTYLPTKSRNFGRRWVDSDLAESCSSPFALSATGRRYFAKCLIKHILILMSCC